MGKRPKISDLTELGPYQRRWTDLPKIWVFLVLILGQLPPTALYCLFLFTLYFPYRVQALETGSAMAAFWPLLVGAAYLFIVTRSRGIITRIDCLLLNIVITATMPVISFVAMVSLDDLQWTGDRPSIETIFNGVPIFLIVGILLLPLGALSGWALWVFGIGPAKLSPPPILPDAFD
ncbi:MAG TPA: hypothetical protein VGM59_00760 [Dongiaceae bacterium]